LPTFRESIVWSGLEYLVLHVRYSLTELQTMRRVYESTSLEILGRKRLIKTVEAFEDGGRDLRRAMEATVRGSHL